MSKLLLKYYFKLEKNYLSIFGFYSLIHLFIGILEKKRPKR